MLTGTDRPFDQKRLRRATWLALVSLAWLQLSLASHQFQHVAAYFADSCDVCVQLDRTDDGPVGQSVLAAAQIGAAEPVGLSPTTIIRQSVPRHFDSRAPPHI